MHRATDGQGSEDPVWPGDTDGTVEELVSEEAMVSVEVGAVDGGNFLDKIFMA